MPYAVREQEGKFIVLNTDTQEVKGEHDTKDEAVAQMRALYANEKSASYKIGRRNNAGDRDRIKAIRQKAHEIVGHTLDLEPEEIQQEAQAETPVEKMEGELAKLNPPQEYPGKALDFTYAKSMGIALPDPSVLAVKSVGTDTIRGYTFIWGNSQQTDVEREYFTKQTDFWDTQLGKAPRPLTWDHAQDEGFKDNPVIGTITEWGDDELGRWYEAKLERARKYRTVIDGLIKAGILGTSSDSAPQYVVREKTGKATWLKTWPWFASALTDVPAEPRMIGSLEFLKSLGVTLPDSGLLARWQWELAKIQLLTVR